LAWVDGYQVEHRFLWKKKKVEINEFVDFLALNGFESVESRVKLEKSTRKREELRRVDVKQEGPQKQTLSL
jgi:hypothetical protein